MDIILPKEKSKVELTDPRTLVVYSKVKMGKSTALSLLEDNLCIDTEEGHKYISSMKLEAKSVSDILNICKEIKKAGCPYKFLTLDTVTALEDIAKPYALQLWKNSPVFTTKYEVKDILDAPNGSGYKFLREAMEKVVGWLKAVCEHVILVCHSKDASIGDNNLTVKDIDLTGKTGRILSAQVDAIGYLYRDDNSNTVISFSRSNKFAECEARPKHLTDKDIVVIENRNGELIPHWDRIYPSLPYSGEDEESKDEPINLSGNTENEDLHKQEESNEEDSKKEEPEEDQYSLD